MGNADSRPYEDDASIGSDTMADSATASLTERGATMVEKLMQGQLCGSLKDTVGEGGGGQEQRDDRHASHKDLLSRAAMHDALCTSASRPDSPPGTGTAPLSNRRGGNNFLGPDEDSDDEKFGSPNDKSEDTGADSMSALFARALVSEVTDNPKTMNPTAMAERERRLMKAQERARQAGKSGDGVQAVGVPGGVKGPPGVLGALQNLSLRGERNDGGGVGEESHNPAEQGTRRVEPPNRLIENRAQVASKTAAAAAENAGIRRGKHTVTIGLSLSRRHSTLGHPDTVTRQTAFDFNELQDRQYRFVSSTDSSGWRAGGGERGGGPVRDPTGAGSQLPEESLSMSGEEGESSVAPLNNGLPGAGSFGGGGGPGGNGSSSRAAAAQAHKIAAPDTVHIPIISIDCESKEAVDRVVASLASGELFIPHMSILPEALSVNGISPPDLVVRFGCERNDDLPPDEWPNWCLEFMHNQLYEYFAPLGARWEDRPFQITLARKVRWKTVKHMNKFFAHSERVINAWRENGPQYLDPQLSYLEDGATTEEVARPHGIYLLRNGRPTNYFAPNFEPPYTTKMTRSLLMNVINKSWDKKRRDWSSEPIPRLVTPGMLLTTMCGCTDGNQGGFIASEATNRLSPIAQPYKPPPAAADTSGEYSEFQQLRDGQQSQKEKKRGVTVQQYREGNASTQTTQETAPNDLSSSVWSQVDTSGGGSGFPTQDRTPVPESGRDFPLDRSNISHATSGAGVSSDGFPAVVAEEEAADDNGPEHAFKPAPSGEVPGRGSPAPPRSEQAPVIRQMEPEEEQEEADTERAIGHPRGSSKRSASRNGGATDGSGGEKDSDAGSRAPGAAAAAVGSSVGESQTTVPIKNTPGRLIEAERERRRERERERELERKKMEALERTLKEHMKEKELNQKKMAELERKLQEQKLKEKERAERGKADREKDRLENEKKMERALVQKAEAKVKKQQKLEKREREKARDNQIKLIALAAEETEKAKAVVSKLQSQPVAPKVAVAAERSKERNSTSTRRSQSPNTRHASAISKVKQAKERRSATSRRSQSPSTRHASATSKAVQAKERPSATTRRSQSPSTRLPSATSKAEQAKDRRSATTRRSQSPSTRHASATPKVEQAKDRRSTTTRRSQSPSTRQRTYDMASTSKTTIKRQQQDDLKASTSGETLEYSVDSSMLGGDPRRSPTSKSNVVRGQGEDFSVAESASLVSAADIIPTDEELFVVGWAKALDQNSGSYYYFTLDRSQTVWENPLLSLVNSEDFAVAPSSAPASNASSSASSGAYGNNAY